MLRCRCKAFGAKAVATTQFWSSFWQVVDKFMPSTKERAEPWLSTRTPLQLLLNDIFDRLLQICDWLGLTGCGSRFASLKLTPNIAWWIKKLIEIDFTPQKRAPNLYASWVSVPCWPLSPHPSVPDGSSGCVQKTGYKLPHCGASGNIGIIFGLQSWEMWIFSVYTEEPTTIYMAQVHDRFGE